MTVWSEIFLGLIAAATVTTAIVQVAVCLAAGRMARRVERLVEKVERDVQPTLMQLHAIGHDAQRAVALATTQIERVDRLFIDLTQTVEATIAGVQSTITAPAREGKALLSALRAAIDAVRNGRRHPRGRQRAEDEDALFI